MKAQNPAVKVAKISLLLFITFLPFFAFTKSASQDSFDFDHTNIYAPALNSHPSVLTIIRKPVSPPLCNKSERLKATFEKKFAFDSDESDYLAVRDLIKKAHFL
jgi:hypothetical protein